MTVWCVRVPPELRLYHTACLNASHSPAAGGGGASAAACLQVAAQRGRQEEGALPDLVAALARADIGAGVGAGVQLQPGSRQAHSGIAVGVCLQESTDLSLARFGKLVMTKLRRLRTEQGCVRTAGVTTFECTSMGARQRSGEQVLGPAWGRTSCDERSRTWSSSSEAGLPAAAVSLVTPMSEPAVSMSCMEASCTVGTCGQSRGQMDFAGSCGHKTPCRGWRCGSITVHLCGASACPECHLVLAPASALQAAAALSAQCASACRRCRAPRRSPA